MISWVVQLSHVQQHVCCSGCYACLPTEQTQETVGRVRERPLFDEVHELSGVTCETVTAVQMLDLDHA